jgi:hypothetical protein
MEINKGQTFIRAKDKFLRTLGRHWPITYEPKFNFKEQWEMTNFENKQIGYRSSNLYTVLSLAQLVLLCFCVWGLTTDLFFNIEPDGWIYIFSLFLFTIDAVELALTFHSYNRTEKATHVAFTTISIFYCLFFLISPVDDASHAWARVMGIAIALHTYVKMSKIYQIIKYYNISSHHRDLVNLFELFFLLITIAHIFVTLP